MSQESPNTTEPAPFAEGKLTVKSLAEAVRLVSGIAETRGSASPIVGVAVSPRLASRLSCLEKDAVWPDTVPVLEDVRINSDVGEVYYDPILWAERCKEQREYDSRTGGYIYTAGRQFVLGVAEPMPLKGFPPGKVRICLRPGEWANAFVKTADGLRAFYVEAKNGCWMPGPEIARNLRVEPLPPISWETLERARDAADNILKNGGACPYDTNGDGDCGRPACPFCGEKCHE